MLKIKLAKYSFLEKQITYLGHVISKEGVRVNDDKVKAIANFRTPRSKKEIKSFLSIAGFFRRFVKGFSDIAAPLTDVLVSTARKRHACRSRNLESTTRDMVQKSNSKTSDPKINVGDKVFLKLNVRYEVNYKLGPKFEGHFKVIEEKIGNRFVVLEEKTGRSRLTHISKLKRIGCGD